jgi:hypothetical protein
MKIKLNNNYLKILKKGKPYYPETSIHHILPISLFPYLEDDLDNRLEIPDSIHRSLHKNFSNYKLVQDPIGCLVKCILIHMPVKQKKLTLGDFYMKDNREFVAQKIVDIMNILLETDPEAIRELCFDQRVICNKELAELADVQVGVYIKGTNTFWGGGEWREEDVDYKVGLLGILNAITLYFGYYLHANVSEIDENGEGKIVNFSIIKQEGEEQ